MNALIARIRPSKSRHNQHSDAGYASETVLVTALLVIAALVVIGIIVAKVTTKANSIDLGANLAMDPSWPAMVVP